MTKTRSGKTTAVKAPSVSSKKNKSTEAETQEDPELMKLRLAALEQALLDKKSKSKKQVTVSSSSSASDSSDSSTSSSSSSDSEREGRRKSSKRKKHQKAVRSSRATGSCLSHVRNGFVWQTGMALGLPRGTKKGVNGLTCLAKPKSEEG